MTKIQHGKIPKWYEKDSQQYDLFNENTENSRTTNQTIEKLLKKYKVKTILDLTCGTGSQVFYLLKKGYQVTGSDISPGMLKIAKRKAKESNVKIKLIHGDMRTIQAGKFDAAITIFNAIGHLTTSDFEKTMRSIHQNLNKNGIYIFDIFNLEHYSAKENVTKFTIDFFRTENNKNYRYIQYSVIDQNGVLISHTTHCAQNKLGQLKKSFSTATLQLYTAKELKQMLERNGFKVIHQCGIDGSRFSEMNTERIVTVAKKLT